MRSEYVELRKRLSALLKKECQPEQILLGVLMNDKNREYLLLQEYLD